MGVALPDYWLHINQNIYIVVLFSIKVFFLFSAGGYFPFVSVSFPNTVSRGDDTYGVFKYEAGHYSTFPFGCSCAGLEVYVSEKNTCFVHI